ncbi:MAG TPA: YciI family protein [Thermoleophilaceae bacterium]|nr:YciI family protein [Thermoleophilaceae bacterium]
MADYFLVELACGPGWDRTRGRREQDGWDDHAAFMDALAEDGFIVMGGPTGTGEADNTFHVVDAPDEAAIRQRLAEDPWANDLLIVHSIRPWTVWLRAPGGR